MDIEKSVLASYLRSLGNASKGAATLIRAKGLEHFCDIALLVLEDDALFEAADRIEELENAIRAHRDEVSGLLVPVWAEAEDRSTADGKLWSVVS